MLDRGVLVVVEGINGAGKSSIIKQVAEHFEHEGLSIVVYKFPDRNGLFGKRIDRYLKGEVSISSKYDILHMFSANRDTARKAILDDLTCMKIVICDRYVFSAIAYHIPRTVDDARKIRLYCNVIGYFDKNMPVPDVVYLIEGDHITRRKGGIAEIFHHTGGESQRLKNMIYKVIKNYSTPMKVLNNYANKMEDVVQYIINDVEDIIE